MLLLSLVGEASIRGAVAADRRRYFPLPHQARRAVGLAVPPVFSASVSAAYPGGAAGTVATGQPALRHYQDSTGCAAETDQSALSCCSIPAQRRRSIPPASCGLHGRGNLGFRALVTS